MSYMVLPENLLAEYERKCQFINTTVSKVDQMIVQRFLEEGYYERHLNKSRALYKSRHDALVEGLRPLQDICKISGENAGVHLLLTFTDGKTEEELIRRAEKEKIKVYGLSNYCIGRKDEELATVLLGYANLTEEQIREAVEILCRCWR
jgi:GntR family transcriptional regulator/MocR family aminotransferase